MTTRERILAEAERQLLDVGYAAFSMNSVRKALGLSSGSMFHAFASKAALAAEVYVGAMADYQNVASRVVLGPGDPKHTVEQFVASHLLWVESNRQRAHFLFMTQPDELLELAAGPLSAANDQFFAAIGELTARAAEHGLCVSLPVDVSHPLIIGPAQEYCRRWTRGLVAQRPTQLTTVFQRSALAALRSTL